MPGDRKGVLLVMYDLPVETSAQRKSARLFRKFLVSGGFQPVQKSVYVKLMRNDSGMEPEFEEIKKAAPKDGTVNAIAMSLSVFLNMKNVCGKPFGKSGFAGDLIMI